MKKVIISIIIISSLLIANEETIKINFKNLKISDFIQMIAKIKNENILIDKDIGGKVNFISVKEIPKKSLMKLLNSVLETKGYTIIRTTNGYLKVVKIVDAGRSGLPVNTKEDTFQIVTEIIEVKDMNVDLLITKLRHLVTKNSKITTSKETNAIILTDYPDKIESIKRIISLLVSKTKQTVKVIKLHHIKATVIYADIQKITKTLFDAKIAKNKLDIISNDSTNTITLVGHVDNINKIVPLIKAADKEGDSSSVTMELVNLKNSNAKDIIKVLDKFFLTKDKKTIYKPQFMNEDELNVIIIRARKADIDDIRDIIEQLDVEKPQVFVQAKIIELSNDLASDVGIKYGITGGKVFSNALSTMSASLGGSSVAIDSTLLDRLTIPSDLSEFFSFGAALSLLENEGAAEVLSEPSLLCLNNKASEIYVGQTQSIVVSNNSGNSATSDNKNQYKREDIGLTLKVKPRLSNDNKVSLEVETIIEDVLATDANGQPITTKRTIKTTAIVEDGQLVVLGGLNKVKDTITKSKVPLLGDIPLLGKLFSSKKKEESKTTLAIMLTPYILDSSRDLSRLKKDLNILSLIQNKYTQDTLAMLEKGEFETEVKGVSDEEYDQNENTEILEYENDDEEEVKYAVISNENNDYQEEYIEVNDINNDQYNNDQTLQEVNNHNNLQNDSNLLLYEAYYVQVGLYPNYESLNQHLQQNDFKYEVIKVNESNNNPMYQLFAGPYDSKVNAVKNLKMILRNYSQDAFIIDNF